MKAETLHTPNTLTFLLIGERFSANRVYSMLLTVSQAACQEVQVFPNSLCSCLVRSYPWHPFCQFMLQRTWWSHVIDQPLLSVQYYRQQMTLLAKNAGLSSAVLFLSEEG